MRNVLRSMLLFLLAAGPVSAQTVQSTSCLATTTCLYSSPNVAGNLLVVVSHAPYSAPRQYAITSLMNESWASANIVDWGGNSIPLFYATAKGGLNAITLGVTADIVIAEYPPAVLDAVAAQTRACCSGKVINVGPVVTTNANDLLLVWTGFNGNPSTAIAGPGFTLDGSVGVVALESQTVTTAGSYSGSISMSAPYETDGAGMIAFKLTGPIVPPPPPPPPPPPQTIPLQMTFLGSGAGQGFTLTVNATAIPVCTLSVDGDCSLAIQICDAVNPPNCITSSSGTFSMVKTVTLPTPQAQTTILTVVTTP